MAPHYIANKNGKKNMNTRKVLGRIFSKKTGCEKANSSNHGIYKAR
jgi:hypothetical protein